MTWKVTQGSGRELGYPKLQCPLLDAGRFGQFAALAPHLQEQHIGNCHQCCADFTVLGSGRLPKHHFAFMDAGKSLTHEQAYLHLYQQQHASSKGKQR